MSGYFCCFLFDHELNQEVKEVKNALKYEEKDRERGERD